MTDKDVREVKDDTEEFIELICSLSKETKDAIKLIIAGAKIVDDAMKLSA